MAKPRPGEERGFVVEQLEFADVVDMEQVAGDPAYTAWIAAGRPSVEEQRHAEDGSHTDPPCERP